MAARTWLVTAALLSPLLALGGPTPAGMEPSEFVERWGKIQYCREAYKHPLNKERVYEFDLQQCAAAEQHLIDAIADLEETNRTQLENAAKQRARVIRANTRDVAWVLGACREACQALASEAEKAGKTSGSATSKD